MVGRVLPTAMCVRGVDDLCVLQFTLIIAAGCALHRRTSRVIHRIELYFCLVSKGGGGNFPPAFTPSLRERDTASIASDAGSIYGYLRDAVADNKVSEGTEDGQKCHLRASQELTNDRDERSCEDGHPRDPYTARRLFNSLPLPREGKTKRKGRRVPGRMLA